MANRIALRAMKLAAAAADRVKPTHPGIVTLIYHRVGAGSGLEVDLPTPLFEAQIAQIAHRAVTLDRALEMLASPETEPSGAVVVTFDDGTVDFADHALPVLERHAVPATLFVATAFIEEQRSFPADGRPIRWSMLRDALTTGLVTVGSHTHTHALLDRMAVADAEADLDRSIGLIGERLGVAARHFAYPKAVPPSREVERAVRTRFRSAALAGTRANRPGATDVHRLARSPVQVSDGLRWFRRKADGGMHLEDDFRAFLNRRRYAGVTR